MDCYWSLYNNKDKSRFDGLRSVQARSIVGSIPKDQIVNWLAWKEGTAEWAPLSKFPELFAAASEDTASHLSFEDADAPNLVGAPVTKTRVTGARSGTTQAGTTQAGTTQAGTTQASVTNPSISDSNFEFSSQSEFNSGMPDDEDAVDVDSGAGSDEEEQEPTRTNTKSFQHLDIRDLPEDLAVPRPRAREEFKPNVENVIEIEEDALEIDASLEEGGFKADKRKSTRYRRKIDAEVEIGDKVMKARTVDLSLGGCQLDRPLPQNLSKKHVKIRFIKGGDIIEAFCQIVLDKAGQPTNRFRFLDVDRIDLLRTWLISPG